MDELSLPLQHRSDWLKTLPTHISDGYDAIQDAQKKERNEVVALLFFLLLPLWIILGIILGILIILLQGYGKRECGPMLC